MDMLLNIVPGMMKRLSGTLCDILILSLENNLVYEKLCVRIDIIQRKTTWFHVTKFWCFTYLRLIWGDHAIWEYIL